MADIPTQAERNAATRTALLDATVASLAEVGYGATTTRAVADRAGVSRGAQTHHFPTKAELVAATVDHLFATEIEQFVRRFAEIPEADRHVTQAFDLLWDIVRSPTYTALLEVLVAARTDPSLRRTVRGRGDALEATVVGVLVATFPELDGDDERAAEFVGFTIAVVQGTAIAHAAGFGDPARTIELTRDLLTTFIEEDRP